MYIYKLNINMKTIEDKFVDPVHTPPAEGQLGIPLDDLSLF